MEVKFDKILGRLREGGGGIDPSQYATKQDLEGKADKSTTPTMIIVDDITALTAAQLEALRNSDIVVKRTGDQMHTYVVAYKNNEDGECSLVYADAWNVEEVYYEKKGGVWSYVVTDITAISQKADKITVASSQPVGGMLPNVLYSLGELSGNTTFAMAAATDNTIANVWCWYFKTGATAPTITWPAQINGWNGGEALEVEAETYYEISVMNGVASFVATLIEQEVQP